MKKGWNNSIMNAIMESLSLSKFGGYRRQLGPSEEKHLSMGVTVSAGKELKTIKQPKTSRSF